MSKSILAKGKNIPLFDIENGGTLAMAPVNGCGEEE